MDKLESIPGLRTSIARDEFFDIVNRHGIAVIGQSGNLVPADKKLYALRDVTATMDSIPLIASSIMSKKLAAGSDGIVLDVKTGSGAFMKTLEDSVSLAKKMVAIGTKAGRRCCALVTNMDIPLGYAVGNSLEMIEAIETLKGNGPKDLTEVCLELAANMLYMADRGTIEECRHQARETLITGKALDALAGMAEGQHGDPSYIYHPEKFARAPFCHEVRAAGNGYVFHMDTEGIGIASAMLGAGRTKKDDSIDYSAGIVLKKKQGDPVTKGEVLAELFASDESLFDAASEKLFTSYTIEDHAPASEPLIYARVTKDGVHSM